ncbi:uncharacterized protein LOC127136628 [Lathyrus oleraceus]|uniref:uncharacterized protein LOC127136628 n=1 Tax=Pisum sativum TaxID=3888 RepID=UPI0021CF818B|nr:uncharacterized protein LOC127136628 [Pisum sativum]
MPSGGDTLSYVKCFKCGKFGHRDNECKNNILRCFKCGKTGHCVENCKSVGPTCYNCGEQGHISINYQNPKKTYSRGNVFALSGSETTSSNNLIRGTCFINNIPLVAIIATSATHSFISLDCAERLGLKLSSMIRSMIVDTPSLGLNMKANDKEEERKCMLGFYYERNDDTVKKRELIRL